MKIFLFIMILMTPDGGQLPPQSEPMETLEACVAKVAEAQKQFAAIDEDFRFTAACIQQSKKANPV